MQQSVQNQHRLDTPLQPPQALQRPGSVPIAVTTPSGTSTEASNVAHSTSSTHLGIARVKQRHRRAEQTRLHHPSSHSFAICAAWYYVAAGCAICCRCFQSWWWRWWPHQKTNGMHHSYVPSGTKSVVAMYGNCGRSTRICCCACQCDRRGSWRYPVPETDGLHWRHPHWCAMHSKALFTAS